MDNAGSDTESRQYEVYSSRGVFVGIILRIGGGWTAKGDLHERTGLASKDLASRYLAKVAGIK